MLFQDLNNENLSRKEREKLYRRAEILSAAIPLFAEKGYESTTIDDIAEKAEYGKGTIYNYFNSKEDIYWAILEEIFNTYLQSLRQIDKEYENFYDFIMRLTKELFSFCVNNRHAFIMITRQRTSMRSYASKPSKLLTDYQTNVDKILIRRIDTAIKVKEINKINPHSFINLYRSMIFPYIYNQMFCNKTEKIDTEAESELIVSILFDGIRSSKT